MKKTLALILALTLCLTAAACGAEKPVETQAAQTAAPTAAPTQAPTEAPTEAPTQAPTEAPAPQYPETISATLRMEGDSMELNMHLFDGGSYVIYLTEDEWIPESYMDTDYLTDRWVCGFNTAIEFRVIHFGSLSPEEAEAFIHETRSTYSFDPDAEGLRGMDFSSNYFLTGQIVTDGTSTFGLVAEYPMEAGDGFGGRTAKMMESFEIK